MSSKAQAEAMGRALNNTGLFQTVESHFKPGQIAVMGRIKAPLPDWLKFVKQLKKAELAIAGTDGMIKVMQDYFLLETTPSSEWPDGKKIVFSWVISMNATNTGAALQGFEKLAQQESILMPTSPFNSPSLIPTITNTITNTIKMPQPVTSGMPKQAEDEVRQIAIAGVSKEGNNAPKPGKRKGVTGLV